MEMNATTELRAGGWCCRDSSGRECELTGRDTLRCCPKKPAMGIWSPTYRVLELASLTLERKIRRQRTRVLV
jgi:hypothetical protein